MKYSCLFFLFIWLPIAAIGQVSHLEEVMRRDSLLFSRMQQEHFNLATYRMQEKDIAIFQVIIDSLSVELKNPKPGQSIVRKKRVQRFFVSLHDDLTELRAMWLQLDHQYQEVDSLYAILEQDALRQNYTIKAYRARKKELAINAKRRAYNRQQKDLTSKEIKSLMDALNSYNVFNEGGDQIILPEFFAYFNLAFQSLQDFQLQTLQEKTAAIELELQRQTDSMTLVIQQQSQNYARQKQAFELQALISEAQLSEKNIQSDSLKARITRQQAILETRNAVLEAKIEDLAQAQQTFALLNSNIRQARNRNQELEQAAEKLDNKVQSLSAAEADLRIQNQAILTEQEQLKAAKFQTDRWLKILAGISILGAILLGIAAISAFRDRQKISRAYRELKQTKDELQLKTKALNLSHRELNHRVKNNLQLISSLIYLQEDEIEDEEAREVFSALQGRIDTIKIVHQQLYAKQEQALTMVNMAEYMEGLVRYIVGNEADIHFQIADIFMEMDHATDIGLIVNELVTNASKYAFPFVENAQLNIEMTAQENMLHLIVKDNGPGFPADFSIETATSFGLTSIVEMFVHKSGKGQLRTYNKGGGIVEIKMPFDAIEGTLTA